MTEGNVGVKLEFHNENSLIPTNKWVLKSIEIYKMIQKVHPISGLNVIYERELIRCCCCRSKCLTFK